MVKTTSGFTIIELLIVIVVIAILAAISVVAYNGIQDRTNDTAVQNDLSRSARNVELYRVDNNRYPKSYTDLVSMKTTGYPIVATQAAYNTSTNNYAFCYDPTGDGNSYGIIARAKSGKMWYISNQQKTPILYDSSAWIAGLSNMCPVVVTSYTNGQWAYQSGTWNTAFL